MNGKMLDFVQIKESVNGRGVMDIYPEFLVKRSKDLMIRAKSFYAVWDEEAGLWKTDEQEVQRMVDKMVYEHSEKINYPATKRLRLLSDFSSKKWVEWKNYCKSLSDNYHDLDEQIIFSNTEVKKGDYVTRKLNYNIEDCETPAYDELMHTLYSPEEKEKLEWALGSVINGESKKLQKFIVIYGEPGTGKGTFLEIIQELFPGYCSQFNAKQLTNGNQFALESLKDNTLIAIQADGDLSKIEDNTLLNSVVSHEAISVNEKFKSIYTMKFKSFLFMGTNKPVKITDAKSGLIRRLIDVRSSGNSIPKRRYDKLRNLIRFELGGIAFKCLDTFNKLGKNYYNSYVPMSMIARTNDFYIFIDDEYEFFALDHKNGITLDAAWEEYKRYCDKAKVMYPFTKKVFRYELRNYFDSFEAETEFGKNWYSGFKTDAFRTKVIGEKEDANWLEFEEQPSRFDLYFKDCKAQYSKNGKPTSKWDMVSSKLSDLDTTKEHYVQLPNYILNIDFDLKDENGNKSLERNIEAASEWPKTYAELSKSGKGIHLSYIYNGNIDEIDNVYDKDIEIKKSVGNAALRRKLTKCNNLNIATISSGLPKKEKRPVVSKNIIQSEQELRRMIVKNLKKEIHKNTKPSIDFIFDLLEEAYSNGVVYDVRDMAPDIQVFANNSTNNAEYCLKKVSQMRFASITEPTDNKADASGPIIFFDIECYPNLFLICWKVRGKGKTVTKMFNPTPAEVEKLFRMKLVGFNNRRYDNHLLYARVMGYNNEQLFKLSQNIIDEGVLKHGFNEAYNLSYTDVLDFLNSQNKMSLKKWEIKLRIHHMEMAIPWDQPVPEEMWDKVGEYCGNDVLATEAVFDSPEGQADWIAREILADISGLTVNDTTNAHTTRIIVGKDPYPQKNYIYTDLSKTFKGYEFNKFGIDKSRYNEGTKIIKGRSIYRGEDPGEGGYALGNPGIYYNVALLDVASMHPSSLIAMNMFGDEYTKRFKDLVTVRLLIKHKEYDEAKKMFDGKLAKYLDDPSTAKNLSNALKTAINSVYGLTSATFPNKLKDERNIDNIVAKRGALFMIDLKHLVEEKGYKVVHIKTDSIKIANADNYIIDFVMNYGKQFGYTFEHEATYDRMCILNDAVYICHDKDGWSATGDQFKVPYVFKTLFSKEPLDFYDLCETKAVTSALYLDFNEGMPEDEHNYTFVGRVGLFMPVKDGCGGGILLRDAGDGKFNAVEGTKRGKDSAWRWLEAETLLNTNWQDKVEMSYFENLANKAREAIEQFGSFDKFVSFDDSPFIVDEEEEEVPFL